MARQMADHHPLELRWRARDGVTIARDGDDALAVTVDHDARVVLRPGSAALTAALAGFAAAPGRTEDELVAAVGAGVVAVARAHHALARFVGNGLIVADVIGEGGVRLATLVPRRRDFAVQPPAAAGDAVLPRFALLRREGDDLLLACPGAACELRLHGDGPAAWFAVAARPVPTGGDDERGALLRLARAHGLLEPAGVQESPARASWEFHDRLFHQVARSHEDLVPRGGTFRFHGAFPSPPAVRPSHPGEDVALPPVSAVRSDPLETVMERRRSARDMAEAPVALAAVSELLWRVGRTTETVTVGPQETIRRPYPSGGSLHELELYLAVGAVAGLPPGFFHYRGGEHRLTRLPGADAEAQAMLESTAVSWGQAGRPPQVTVVIATRLPRLAWKYSAIAYKVSLLNAGVLLGNLALVTTDLGLAGAPVGSGDPGLFARATGCDPLEETSIAEFGFGAPAAEPHVGPAERDAGGARRPLGPL